MQTIRSKNHTPDSLVFSALIPIQFDPITLAASEASSTVAARFPLPVGVKIIGLAAQLTGSLAGSCSVNIVDGEPAYEGATAALGYIYVSGSASPAGTDTITATINGTPITTAAQPSGTTKEVAANALASAINSSGAVNGTVNAVAAGYFNGAAVVTIYALTGGTAGNAVTLAASSNNGVQGQQSALSAVASGATLTGGLAAGGVPTLATTDSTEIGVVPSNTALPGQALFATDQALVMNPNQVQNLYPVSDEFDAIFPKNSDLTVRVTTGAGTTGTLKIVALGQTFDQRPDKPQYSVFLPTLSSF